MMTKLDISHFRDLRKSGLNEEIIEMMGVRSVRPEDIGKLADGGLTGVESVLEFPYPEVNGFSRYKLFPSFKGRNGHTIKYLQRKGTGCHLYILAPVRAVLENISAPLRIVEGEKKAAAGVQAGLNCIGIGGLWNWVDGETGEAIGEIDKIPWVNRPIEIIPDSDVWSREDSQRAVFALSKNLEERGAEVLVVVIPQEGKEKMGLDDFLLKFGKGKFPALNRINLKHPTLHQHSKWWRRWKVEREKKRLAGVKGDETPNSNKGRGFIVLSTSEPWPEEVSGAELVQELVGIYRKFISLSAASSVAQALWVIHSHAFDGFDVSPLLVFTSPVMRCGKTLNQAVTGRLVPRPLFTSNITAPALYRTIESKTPTLLIDEADTFLELSPELRGVLNSSHFRNSAVVIRTSGDEHEPRVFSTWCPKAVALIGNLPPTLMDRSVVIQMRRKRKNDHVERFSPGREYPELEILRRKIGRWVMDNRDALCNADPKIPDALDDRAKDNWRPLLAIADVVGGSWPKWARTAARHMVGGGIEDSSAIELLRDVRTLLSNREKISSEDLVVDLNSLRERSWPDWNKGKGITQRQVAKLLRGFAIHPKTIRVEDKTPKGYETKDFFDAFERYLEQENSEPPPQGGIYPQQAQQPNETEELERIFNPQQEVCVADEKSEPTSGKDRDVADVADETPWEEV